MKDRYDLLEILAEADKDVRNGRVAPIHDTFNDLRLISELNAGFASGEENRWISDDEVAEHFKNRRRMVKG